MQDNQVTETTVVVNKYNSCENDSMQVLQNQTVNDAVAATGKGCKGINLAESVKRLSTIADVMHLAYIATHHMPSNVNVVSLMTKYQRVVTDSNIACSKFVASSLSALEYHNGATGQLQAQKPTDVLKYVGMTGKIAKEMSGISSDLVQEVYFMCELAAEALEKASKDDSVSVKQKEEIMNMKTQYEANQAELRKSTKIAEARSKKAAEKELRSGERADGLRNEVFFLSKLSDGLGPASKLSMQLCLSPMSSAVGNNVILPMLPYAERVLKAAADEKMKEANRESKREEAYREHRKKLREQKRTAAADLAGVLVKIEGMKGEVSKLDKAIFALELASKCLGQITTIFEDIRVFWTEIHDHCGRLEEMSQEESNENHVHDGMCISQLWYSWVALCTINEAARVAMEKVADDVKAVMNDLPTEEEGNQRFLHILDKLELKIVDDIKYYETA